MPRKPLLLLICLAAILFILPCSAMSQGGANFLPVSAIKRDMVGYGLTVFQGTKVEKFQFRVLGVLKNANTGRDLILIRASGGPIDGRGAGIIAGMSGSPCYIDDKLIGAVGFSISFSKEPIGMVTPIADMLEALDEKLPKTFPRMLPAALPEPIKVGEQTFTSISIGALGDPVGQLSGSTMSMMPLMTPVIVGGMSERGVSRLQDSLRPKGIQVMSGPGGGALSNTNFKLEPGSAVGMSLAMGDIDMTSVGTLTYIDGDKFVAFGHPMMAVGSVDAILTGAYVHDVVASFRGSTKIASPTNALGRVEQDRPWSVAGRIGAPSKTIPVQIRVDNKASGRKKAFNVRVIDHPLVTYEILSSIVADAIFQMQPSPGDIAASVDFKIETDSIGTISRENSFFAELGIDSVAASDIGNVFVLLGMNKYEPIQIKSVKVDVKLESKRLDANIDRIFVMKDEFEPGDTVDVGVVLRPYRRDRITKTIQVKIPQNAPDGAANLLVRGGGVTEVGAPGGAPSSAGVAVLGPDDLANSDNAPQLIEKYLKREKNNQLVAKLIIKSNTPSVEGQELTDLPSVIGELMLSGRTSSAKSIRTESKSVAECEYVVKGGLSLPINIKRNVPQEFKTSSPPAPAAPPAGTSPAQQRAQSVEILGSVQYAATGPQPQPAAEPAKPADKKQAADEKPEQQPKQPAQTKPETSAPAAKASTPAEPKTVVRALSKWQLNKQSDFAKGSFEGTSADSLDRISMAPSLRKLCDLPEQFVWSMLAVPGGVLVGTGTAGRIYRVEDDGTYKIFYQTGEVAVHALLQGSSGDVFAATSPSGKIFKIAPDGTGSLFCRLDTRHILALAPSADGGLLAGAGDSGKLYHISSDGSPVVVATLPADNIYCLFAEPDNSILIGTGPQGVLYRLGPDGLLSVVYDSDSTAVSSVTKDSKGRIYAGLAPKGGVCRIDPGGKVTSFLPASSHVMSMFSDSKDRVLAAAGSAVAMFWQDGASGSADCGADKVQYACIASGAEQSHIYAGTLNPASVYSGPLSSKEAVYESPIFDSKSLSNWSTLRWSANTPEGSQIVLQTRTGSSAEPGPGWSVWSLPYQNLISSKVISPKGRYIQFRAQVSGADMFPTLTGVEISYLTANQPPKVKFVDSLLGSYISGKKDIKWTGTDPDKDTLSYRLHYTSDEGKSWNMLLGPGVASAGTTEVDVAKIEEKIKTELEKSKDIPEDMKKSLLPASTAAAKPAPASPTATTYSWDTKSIPDGVYRLKLVGSDVYSNPDDPQTDTAISDSFIICNTPPTLRTHSKSYNVATGEQVLIEGSAFSAGAVISGVQYTLDSKTWIAAACADGIYDSGAEDFSIRIDGLEEGKYTLEIQAIDSAGNSVKESIELICK